VGFVLLGDRSTVVHMMDGRSTPCMKLRLYGMVMIERRRWTAVKQSKKMSCPGIVLNLFRDNRSLLLLLQLSSDLSFSVDWSTDDHVIK
jgi:hypothetical protein